MNPSDSTFEAMRNELESLRQTVEDLKHSKLLLSKAEASLKDEAIRRRMLVEQSSDGIVVLTTDGKVYEANQTYADQLGYTPEEVRNLYIWDWQHNFTKDQLIEIIQKVDEKGDRFETTHTRKDRSVFDVEICTNGTICAGQKLIFCVCRDITQRKNNEARLRESQEQLATFIDHFRGIAYQVALDKLSPFTPQLFRGAIEPISGYQQGSLLWDTIVHPDDREDLARIRTTFLVNPAFVAQTEYRIIRKDLSVRWVQETAQMVNLGGKPLLHGTIFDITDRKEAEDANVKLEERIRHSEKLEAIGTLAGGVAHDFNNILGIIMGYADLALAELPVASKTHNKLVHIRKASDRARDIIKQLLTFSRKVGPKKQPVDSLHIINETVDFIQSTLPSNIHFEITAAPDKLLVFADSTQLHQVFMNLFVNAIQALRDTGGVISVSFSKVDNSTLSETAFLDLAHGEYIRFVVADNGPGISPNNIARIFEPYFTTRESGKGSGMGLAVVLGIIENHDGAITVNSTLGAGTAFTFLLPLYTKHTQESALQSTSVSSGSESILFIDDEEDITAIAKLILDQQGFSTTTETDPRRALDIFTKNPAAFDVVVTDMTMPYLDGEKLFTEIRKVRPDIPVIMCTGHSAYMNEARALQLGIADFVLKPLDRITLAQAVRTALDRHPLNQKTKDSSR